MYLRLLYRLNIKPVNMTSILFSVKGSNIRWNSVWITNVWYLVLRKYICKLFHFSKFNLTWTYCREYSLRWRLGPSIHGLNFCWSVSRACHCDLFVMEILWVDIGRGDKAELVLTNRTGLGKNRALMVQVGGTGFRICAGLGAETLWGCS